MLKNKIVGLILLLSGIIFFHNILFYPAEGGFDYVRRTDYIKIISQELRFPTYEETSQAYDAPVFYFLSGLAARAISFIRHGEFLEALASVRFLTAILGLITFYLWYKIFDKFYPKSKVAMDFFVFYLVSIPVFYRVSVMLIPELLTVFNASLTFYYFICHFLTKPTYKKSIMLATLMATGLLTRITFFSITLAILTGIMIIFYFKNKSVLGIKFLTVMSLVIIMITGWFYLGRHQGKLLDFGIVKEMYDKNPKHEKIRLDFYYNIPFKLMMNYPVRPYLSIPSYLLPIYYSDFWGDYWNYFPQTRFGENELSAAKANRHSFSNKRVKYLAWQNKVNLMPTILMILSFIYIFTDRTISIVKKRWNVRIIVEFIFSLSVVFTWGSLLVILTRYFGGEGDLIKAPYSLLIIPIYVYLTTVFLFTVLKKVKYIYWPTVIILLFSIINNLIFSWF